MDSAPGRKAVEDCHCRRAQHASYWVGMSPVKMADVMDPVPDGKQLSVATEQECFQLASGKIRMLPNQTRRIETVQITFRNQAVGEKGVILFRSRNRAQDVERRAARTHGLQFAEMLMDRLLGVCRKANYVGEVPQP